jgi:probable rRNA maturation factor
MDSSNKRISLSVQYACSEKNIPSRAQLRRWVSASAERSLQLTVRFVNAKESRALNRDFRGKDYATNVLSFVYEASTADTTGTVGGDIAICVDVIRKEAKEQKKTVNAHFAHMVIHGALHVQGYDHERVKDASVMEAREIELLHRFRIANPYE